MTPTTDFHDRAANRTVYGSPFARAFVEGIHDELPQVGVALNTLARVLAEAYRREFAAQRALVDYLLSVPWWIGFRSRLALRRAKRWAK